MEGERFSLISGFSLLKHCSRARRRCAHTNSEDPIKRQLLLYFKMSPSWRVSRCTKERGFLHENMRFCGYRKGLFSFKLRTCLTVLLIWRLFAAVLKMSFLRVKGLRIMAWDVWRITSGDVDYSFQWDYIILILDFFIAGDIPCVVNPNSF